MLKLIVLSRCTLCTISSQTSLRSASVEGSGPNLKDFVTQNLRHRKTFRKNDLESRRNRVLLRISNDQIMRVTALLQKFNIDTSQLKNDKKILVESLHTIEKRILFLQEIGVPRITSNHIVNFIKGMYLPVNMFKANVSIDPDVNLAKNIFSHIENSNINYEDLNHLHDNMLMKEYYTECIVHFVKNELDLNDVQVKHISYKKFSHKFDNSIRLIQQMLKFMKKDFQFSNSVILKNRWLFGIHPKQAEGIIELITKQLKLSPKIAQQCPRLVDYDLNDLKTLINYIKKYDIKTEMFSGCSRIFMLTPAEFKRRIDYLLMNPYTLVYQKHPRFLLLVQDYHTILPRVRYLEEKNLKFATIFSLTTFHNYLEQLINTRKMKKNNLLSFLESQFHDDAEELLQQIMKHPCYAYVPLVQIYETLTYLKEQYPKKVFYMHIYAILYTKMDLHTAYEIIKKDPRYSKLSQGQVLAFCVYKIEEKCHFTGEGVLAPEKYTESLNEDSTNQDQSKEDSKVQNQDQSKEDNKVQNQDQSKEECKVQNQDQSKEDSKVQ